MADITRPGCKPASPVRTQVRTFPTLLHPTQARAVGAFGLSGRAVGCEPQTLQTLFFGRTVARYCAVASRMGLSPGRTHSPGASVRAPTLTIEDDCHHRHNHHIGRRRDSGDGCDGHRLLFTPPETQIHPGSATVTHRRVPASTPEYHAGRAAHARHQCGPGPRRKTRGRDSGPAAKCAGQAD